MHLPKELWAQCPHVDVGADVKRTVVVLATILGEAVSVNNRLCAACYNSMSSPRDGLRMAP